MLCHTFLYIHVKIRDSCYVGNSTNSADGQIYIYTVTRAFNDGHGWNTLSIQVRVELK